MINNIWQYFQNHTPTLATIFFFIFFCYVVYSVFKKGQEDKFDKYSKIPLNDERNNKNTLKIDDKSQPDLSTNKQKKSQKN
jgi:cbb3-type cytochrome oxidase subunit 3